MALGSASGYGRSSSSTSNLSALAPPFTVDRYNQNPIVNFTEIPYPGGGGGSGAVPLGHTWEYHPSETSLDEFRQPELNIDGSTRTTCMPLSNECRYSVPESVNPSRTTQWSGLNNPVVSMPLSSNDYNHPLPESVNPSYTQWSGANKPGVSMPMLSSDYPYSVPDSVNQSGTQWSGPHFGYNWQYHSPYPSETRPEVFPQSELDVGKSARTTSMPLADVYEYSAPESVNPSSTQWSGLNSGVKSPASSFYVAEVEPYCPAYVPPIVTEDSPLVSLGESGYHTLSSSRIFNSSTQVDHAKSLSGLEYVPQWGGAFNGLAEGKWGNQIESTLEKVNVGNPLAYKNYMSQDAAVECSNGFGGDSGVSYRKSTDGTGGKGFIGSFSLKDGNDKSLFAQELGGIPYVKSTDGFAQGGCAGSLRVGNINDETIYAQTLGFLPFKSSGAQFLGSSSPFSESRPPEECQELSENFFNYQKKYGPNDPFMQDSGSLVKPSPAVVIRAPVNDPSSRARYLLTSKNISTGSVTNACKKSDSPKPSKAKDTHVLPTPESLEGSFNGSQLDSGKELSSKPPLVDLIDTTLKVKSASRVTDTRVLPNLSLSLDNNHSCKYTENPSDSLDNHYPAEDSPCWKGAPASQYSPCDVLASSVPLHISKELDGSYDLDENGNNVAPSGKDPIKFPSQKPLEAADNKIGGARKDMVSSLNDTSYSSFPTKEPKSADDGINFNDASEGAAVAYHAAENVLGSPSAQENHVQDQPPSGREATPKMDVSTLINAIHNLAELLRFNCSADSGALREHDQEVLTYVISNLDACMSKKSAESTPAPEHMFSQQDASSKTGELHDLHLEKCANQPQQMYLGTVKSSGQCDHPLTNTEKTSFSQSAKKGESRPYYLSLGDDGTSGNKDMVQAIKKILHENLNFEGEMQSQSLLFKNLWLEAEAKLCSIGYRARFDHMRNQMDKYELNRSKVDVEKVSAANYSPYLKETSGAASQAKDGSMAEGTKADHSTFGTNNHVDDVEASSLTRYNMLMHQDGKSNLDEQHHPHKVDTRKSEGQFGPFLGGFDPEDTVNSHSTFGQSPEDNMDTPVLARFHMIRCRDDTSNSEEHQQTNVYDALKAEGQFGNNSTSRSTPTVDVDSAVLARSKILRRRVDNSNHDEHLHPSMVETTESEGRSGSAVSGFDPESIISNHSTLSTNSPVDDVESSVLARYNILRCRDDKSRPEHQQQPDMVDTVEAEGQFGSSVGGCDTEGTITNHSTLCTEGPADDVRASVLARYNILKRRDDKSNSEDQLSDTVDNKNADGQYGSYIDASGYESIKETHLCITDDPVSRADRHGRLILPGWYDNSSSDWEHVLKDDFTWQK